MSNTQISPTPPTDNANQAAHKRTYQACLPCRDRKVRCDLGPVDNPGPPPCARCKRESKECVFSKTRRKTKGRAEDEDSETEAANDYESRHQRKRLRLDSNTDVSEAQRSGFRQHAPPQMSPISARPQSASGNFPFQPPRTPGGSLAAYTPLQRPGAPNKPQQSANEDEEPNNYALAAAQIQNVLQQREVFGGHDALNLLSAAASEAQVSSLSHRRTNSLGSGQRPRSHHSNTPGSQTLSSPHSTGANMAFNMRSVPDAAVDPALAESNEETAYEDALKAWSRFRFVRAGWFSAKEAIDYLQYFREHLSPLTPICLPDISDCSKHGQFITDEPMLVVTVLTIASRYMKLSGPGASSRPYAIHEKLWRYLQGMIERMIWGQEQFGGSVSNAAGQAGADVNPLLRKGLRTLGTVESLVLLTEWHPRALHFPPGDDDDELMAPEDPTASAEPRVSFGGEKVNAWLEPCWRSDRMCWMLLGNALTLAFEIGVFDETAEKDFAEFEDENSAGVKRYLHRRQALRDLLLIYVTQTSGRLGLTSMLPSDRKDPGFGDRSDPRLQDRLDRLRKSNAELLHQIKTDSYTGHETITQQDRVLYFWKEMAYFFEKGNIELFPNRRYTRELITSGKYRELLQKFNPLFREWCKNLEKAGVNEQMRNILLIEYEYSRVYVNTLALQAVVERCTNDTPAAQVHEQASNGTTTISSKTLLQWYGDDQQYIREIVDGCRHTLQIVVEGLAPGDFLRHAPVRTYFRIISVAIVLLKTFALGAMAEDVAVSLSLLDQAVKVLRTCIVDDVHIANNFADLCDKLTRGIRSRFVRLAGGGSTAANSNGVSRAGSPGLTTTAPTSPSTSRIAMGPPMSNYPLAHQGWGAHHTSNLGNTFGNMPNSAYHPLNGIRTDTYDPNRDNGIFMPPPNHWTPFDGMSNASSAGSDYNVPATAGQGSQMGSGMMEGEDGQMAGQDWLALPLDNLINSYGADVNQTIYGPDVGGVDMLDLLLGGMDGAGANAGHGGN